MARTERESDRRRRKEKWQTYWCCRDQQRICKMAQASAEKLGHTGSAEKKKSGFIATKRAVGKFARVAFAERKKNRAVCLNHQIMRGENQGEREPSLDERERDQSGSMERKR